jgi:MFS transporter, NNP family, nitrate/nitrite transporter
MCTGVAMRRNAGLQTGGLPVPPVRRAVLMLAVASFGYLLSGWAWTLLSPLAPQLRETLRLSPLQQALIVAVPVLVGTLGRMPVGALTDRFGGRCMFVLVVLVTIAAVLELGLFGHRSLAGVLLGGALLGSAGTVFAVGVPFVTAWFSHTRRGLAAGVFGMGICGSAISGLTTVRMAADHGTTAPFVAVALALTGFALLALLVLRDAPHRPMPDQRLAHGLVAALRLRITWQASGWYGIALGAFTAFSVYLPAYLNNAYGVAPSAAADRMAAFVSVAVLMRPIGGWLADRLSPMPPLAAALAVVAVAALVQAFTPTLDPVATVALLTLSAGLGVASAATVTQIGLVSPPAMVGVVTGIVTAVAGVAGAAAPLLMALAYSRSGSYGPALALLAVVTTVGLLGVLRASRRGRRPPRQANSQRSDDRRGVQARP